MRFLVFCGVYGACDLGIIHTFLLNVFPYADLPFVVCHELAQASSNMDHSSWLAPLRPVYAGRDAMSFRAMSRLADC
jgi:hypothetical protein